jgi:glycosyltransferase involved in cell wall biosynthesis
MNLLYICKSLPQHFQGGIQTHVWQLSDCMIQRGHSVTLLTAGGLRRGEVRYELEGRTIVELPYFPGRKLPYVSVLAEEWAFNAAATTWLRKHSGDFDLIHAQGRSGFIFAGQQGKTPLVTTIHGLVSVENAQSGRTGTVASWAIRQHEQWATRYEQNAMQHSDGLIAVSEALLEHMKQSVPNIAARTRVIPNGIHISKISSNNSNTEGVSSHRRLLFVGRLDPIKGVFPLFDAMKQVKSDIELVMVGDGPSRAELEKRIVEAGLQKRIRLVGAQPATVVQEWLRQSTALVLPSFYESLPLVIMEANAAGLPVIASEVGGIPTLVQQGDNGWLTPPNDPEALAKTIDWLFSDLENAKKMGENGRKRMQQQFSWHGVTERTEALYEQLMAQKQPVNCVNKF